MGTSLPVQAILEPTHGTWEESAFFSYPGKNSELSVGVLRLHTGRDMPRERGCVGLTGEVGILSRNVLLKHFSMFRATV